jgi:hypothetical protein
VSSRANDFVLAHVYLVSFISRPCPRAMRDLYLHERCFCGFDPMPPTPGGTCPSAQSRLPYIHVPGSCGHDKGRTVTRHHNSNQLGLCASAQHSIQWRRFRTFFTQFAMPRPSPGILEPVWSGDPKRQVVGVSPVFGRRDGRLPSAYPPSPPRR